MISDLHEAIAKLEKALARWTRRLADLCDREATAWGNAKFKIQEEIIEAKAKISELESEIEKARSRLRATDVDRITPPPIGGARDIPAGRLPQTGEYVHLDPDLTLAVELHKQYALRAMLAHEAAVFCENLMGDTRRILRQKFESAESLVNFLAEPHERRRSNDKLLAIRGALRDCPKGPARDRCELAAIASYFLVTCLLVSRTHSATGGKVVVFEKSDDILYAMIASAIFGGKFAFQHSTESAQAKNVFCVAPPAGSETAQGVVHEAHRLLFDQNPETAESSLDETVESSLEETAESFLDEARIARMRADILAGVESILELDEEAIVFVFKGEAQRALALSFAEQVRVPVLLAGNDPTVSIVGMSALDLRAKINELWRDLRRAANSSESAPQSKRTKGKAMPENSPFNQLKIKAGDGATFAFTSGDGSPSTAQSCADKSDLESTVAELRKLLTQLSAALSKEIDGKSAEQASAILELSQEVGTALQETGNATPELGQIRNTVQSLEKGLQRSSNILSSGDKILDIIKRLLAALAAGMST